jgi:hypothetical protein
MSSHHFRRAIAVAALPMMVFAGCSGDSTGTDNDDLILQGEALEIFSAFMSVAFQGFGLVDTSGNTTTFSGTGTCTNGGTVAYTGNWVDTTNDSGTGTFTYTLVQTPSSCQVQTSGGVYTVQGDPNITWTWNYSTQNFQPIGNYTYSMEGGFRYTGAGSGSCDIDINYVFAVTGSSGTVTGSMCGYNYNQTFGAG